MSFQLGQAPYFQHGKTTQKTPTHTITEQVTSHLQPAGGQPLPEESRGTQFEFL